MKKEEMTTGWSRTAAFSWLLLFAWLSYSAVVLWKLHMDAGGVSMCISPRDCAVINCIYPVLLKPQN